MKTYTKLPAGLPPLPEVPKGFDRWELKGWSSDWFQGKKGCCYAFAEKNSKCWYVEKQDFPAGGSHLFYLLAVKDSVKKLVETREIYNPENVPASKLPEGYRFTYVGESISDGTKAWMFYGNTHDLCGGVGNKVPGLLKKTPWSNILKTGFTIAVPISSKPEKEVVVNKKTWVAFSERKPAKGDLPIVVAYMDGQSDMQFIESLSDLDDYAPRELPEIWISIPPIPVTPKPESPFETWWKSTGFKHGKKEALAAWTKAQEGK